MEQLNVLISAYACRPNMGSEPGVGWNTAWELAKYHKVWVVTRENNRPFIEAELAKTASPSLQFIYCDIPKVFRWCCKSGMVFHYYLWQISAYFRIRTLLPELSLDLIHHVTYVRYSTPSFLVLLPIPLIWGPVGGGESAPLTFWSDFNWYGKIYELLRSLIRLLGELDPFVSLTIKKSRLVVATTNETANRLKKLGAKNVQVESQVRLSAKELTQFGQSQATLISPFRIVSIGRLFHWKGFHLGLQAYANADLPCDVEYWIIGEGPDRNRLQKLATNLNIIQSVKFLGNLPRKEVIEKVSACQVLVHPSLHESGGFVCLEAMAIGLPVVCLDLGGPTTQVTEQTGFKISAITPEQAVQDIAIAISKLAYDPDLREKMGKAGQLRATSVYSWEARSLQLNQLYSKIVSKASL